ncbi:tRNA (N(6)-L-threonylcarbamoyladenosine(37)-C(2))-methylthiotransferase MtaB [Candidatus Falkowbacteria bacterium]|nr:tRNA (N(6)-L-threonylcarbamoyladenosine(37)-C(2))-methylthiotransferase MtaB [Candidatus Falkowbacteria bacterium]
MEKITYKIYGLGCKVNQYDAGYLAKQLELLGFLPAEGQADLAIINTCTVTQAAIAKDMKTVEKARQENPHARIAITGCLPVNYRDQALSAGVDYVASVKECGDLVKQVALDFGLALPSGCGTIVTDQSGHSRYFLKVQDGCQQFCSYCIIPYNRGKLSSRPGDEVLREVEAATEQGFEEIVLCGIHLGLYGINSEQQSGNDNEYFLADLLEDLFKIDKLKKVRLSSIEITEVNDRLIELMSSNRKFARHLHIPLQAGTDKILKSMNRPYDLRYFSERIAKLRAAVPEVAISTDLIVGFPGESDEDFKETLEHVESLYFSKVHVFPFSAHEKTPAFSLPDQLDEAAKKQRASAMQKLSDLLERKYNESFLGHEIEAIIDGRSQGRTYRAKSEYYFDINFETDEIFQPGESVKVKNWQLVK